MNWASWKRKSRWIAKSAKTTNSTSRPCSVMDRTRKGKYSQRLLLGLWWRLCLVAFFFLCCEYLSCTVQRRCVWCISKNNRNYQKPSPKSDATGPALNWNRAVCTQCAKNSFMLGRTFFQVHFKNNVDVEFHYSLVIKMDKVSYVNMFDSIGWTSSI